MSASFTGEREKSALSSPSHANDETREQEETVSVMSSTQKQLLAPTPSNGLKTPSLNSFAHFESAKKMTLEHAMLKTEGFLTKKGTRKRYCLSVLTIVENPVAASSRPPQSDLKGSKHRTMRDLPLRRSSSRRSTRPSSRSC